MSNSNDVLELPVSLSISYLTLLPLGISMITLTMSGTFSPGERSCQGCEAELRVILMYAEGQQIRLRGRFAQHDQNDLALFRNVGDCGFGALGSCVKNMPMIYALCIAEVRVYAEEKHRERICPAFTATHALYTSKRQNTMGRLKSIFIAASIIISFWVGS